MHPLRKKLYAAAGYNTVFYGAGRKEFNPKQMPPFENYLLDTAAGTASQLGSLSIDEGVIGSFMSAKFLNQANLPGFLPFMLPTLSGKPCLAVEGACATGSKAITAAIKTVLSDMADAVFVTAFEMQNTMKAVYGADALAGASYYRQERKNGESFFFPGVFARRAKAYYERYGYEYTRAGMAKWYEQNILNARKNPKAQEFANQTKDLIAFANQSPDPKRFVPYLNRADCSKVSDGASSILILSEEGVKKNGIDKEKVVEIIAVGEAEADITQVPKNLNVLSTTKIAVAKALRQANVPLSQMGWLEVHDCFSISGLLALEAAGFAKEGQSSPFIQEGNTSIQGIIPTNLSGGLAGFGHPTGATGVRQLVDLWQQLTGIAPNQAPRKKDFGMMINMGGDDVTVTCLIVKVVE